ncbi:MAG: glycosyltransferase [Treponema sp.]|nr:glycosyltransferase [Treponema sp.]
MKIVMFTDAYWPRVNGVSVSVESFSYALIRAGNEVMIICPFYPESSVVERISDSIDMEKDDSLKPLIIRVPSSPLIISKEDRLAKFYKLFWVSKQIESFSPDIIHINTEFIIAEFGFQYAKQHKLPIIFTFHTLWEDYAVNYIPLVPTFLMRFVIRRVLKFVLKRSDLIIVPTQQIHEFVKKYKVKKEIRLLPTGIDPLIFTREKTEIEHFKSMMIKKYPQLQKRRILLFAGRIAREKNIDFLLSIAPAIIKKHPEVVFLFAGNGPDLIYFEEECASLNIADHCIFTGYLAREDLALTYGMSDIFVFPSLTETQGLVTIEAMLSGIPVVAIGEMGTIMVMNGDNGGFMVHNDPDEFSKRVLELLEDEALYRRKSEEAKNYAQRWTIDTMTIELEGIYRYAIKTFDKTDKKRKHGR